MNKKICDMCGSDAPLNGQDTSTYCSDKLVIDDKLLCDDTAKIQIVVNTNLIGHSTRFSGPPDLCPDCFIKCVRLLGEKVIRYGNTLKEKK